MTSLRKHGPTIGALFLVHLVCFSRHLLFEDGAPGLLAPWDFASQYYPWLVYGSDVLKSGSFPFWNPYSSCGTPFFLNPQSQLLSPVTLLIGSTVGYSHRVAQSQLVLTLFVGGVGTYALAFALWKDRSAALLAAMGFSLSSTLFTNLEHMTFINCFALTPWLFWASTIAHVEGRWWTLPVLALLTNLIITSGYPGITFTVSLWLIAYHLYLLHWQRNTRGFWLSAGGALLGVGLSAAYWIPLIAHRADFTRGAPLTLAEVFAPAGSLTPTNLWTMLFHVLAVSPLPGDVVDRSMRGLYFGALLLPLMAVSLARRHKDPIVSALNVLTAGSLLMSLGGMFVGRRFLHSVIELFNFSRFPAGDSRFLFCLGAVLLASRGAALIFSGDRNARRIALAGVKVLCVTWAVGLFVLRGVLDAKPYAEALIPFTSAELCLGAVALLALRFFSQSVLPRVLCALVALELSFCVLAAGAPLGSATSKESYASAVLALHTRKFAVAEAMRPRHNVDKIDDESQNQGHLTKAFFVGEYNPMRLRRRDHLIGKGLLSWLQTGPRVVGLPASQSVVGSTELLGPAASVAFTIVDYQPNRVDYRVTLERPAVLVFNEIYFPGWQAEIDGKAVPVFEVAGGLRAISAEPGVHVVKTWFRPASFFVGLGIALASLLVLIGYCVQQLRKRPVVRELPAGS